MSAISITGASFIPSINAKFEEGTAGATLTRGQSLYYDSDTDSYKLFDADDTTKDEFAGLACEDVASGQRFLILKRDPALLLGGTLAVGDDVWGSPTAGGVTKTRADLVAPSRVWHLGVCNGSSNQMNFSPVKGGIIP